VLREPHVPFLTCSFQYINGRPVTLIHQPTQCSLAGVERQGGRDLPAVDELRQDGLADRRGQWARCIARRIRPQPPVFPIMWRMLLTTTGACLRTAAAVFEFGVRTDVAERKYVRINARVALNSG